MSLCNAIHSCAIRLRAYFSKQLLRNHQATCCQTVYLFIMVLSFSWLPFWQIKTNWTRKRERICLCFYTFESKRLVPMPPAIEDVVTSAVVVQLFCLFYPLLIDWHDFQSAIAFRRIPPVVHNRAKQISISSRSSQFLWNSISLLLKEKKALNYFYACIKNFIKSPFPPFD